jgi:hypothetical protein
MGAQTLFSFPLHQNAFVFFSLFCVLQWLESYHQRFMRIFPLTEKERPLSSSPRW